MKRASLCLPSSGVKLKILVIFSIEMIWKRMHAPLLKIQLKLN